MPNSTLLLVSYVAHLESHLCEHSLYYTEKFISQLLKTYEIETLSAQMVQPLYLKALSNDTPRERVPMAKARSVQCLILDSLTFASNQHLLFNFFLTSGQ